MSAAAAPAKLEYNKVSRKGASDYDRGDPIENPAYGGVIIRGQKERCLNTIPEASKFVDSCKRR